LCEQAVQIIGVQHLGEGDVLDAAGKAEEAQGVQVRCGYEDPRPQGEQVHRPVRFLKHHVLYGKGGVPDLETVADAELQPVQQTLFDDQAAGGKHLVEVAPRGEEHLAVEGVPRFDDLQVAQERGVAGHGTDHGIEIVVPRGGDASRAGEVVQARLQGGGERCVGVHDQVAGVERLGVAQQ